MIVVAMLGATVFADVTELTQQLQALVDQGAEQDNVSYSFAVHAEDFSVAVAAGFDDHVTGTKVSPDSLIPAGSALKPYTAVAALKLSEQGKLDLDKPVVPIVDPWLAAQGFPSMGKLWNNSMINTVTSRQLLSMRAGFDDYDDQGLLNWTISNPDKDYLPIDYITNLPKKFLFPPGHGGCYSSDGFVLMGMVMAAVTGAKEWEAFDQLAALGPIQPPFKETIFMKTGACNKYPGVVHQYGRNLLTPVNNYAEYWQRSLNITPVPHTVSQHVLSLSPKTRTHG
jgi:CubicO group peptidase (beta-lactamase class C family)